MRSTTTSTTWSPIGAASLTNDLLSELIRIEDDGDRLDAGEVRMLAFSILLAGTDTTRSQLAASMQVLCDHPEQWALLRDRPELANARRRGDDASFAVDVQHAFAASPRTSRSASTPSPQARSSSSTLMRPTGTRHLRRPDPLRHHPRRPSTDPDVRRRCPLLPRREPGEAWNSPKHSRSLLSVCRTPGVVGPAPWRPLLGLSGPTSLPIEFDR